MYRARVLFCVLSAISSAVAGAAHATSDVSTRPPTPPAALTAAAFSPDGREIAVGGFQRILVIDVATGRTRLALSGLQGEVTSVAYSPNGTILASAGGAPGQSGEIKLWDVKTGHLVRSLTGHTDVVYGIAFRADGRQLASASYDHLAALWDIPSNAAKSAVMRPLKDHTDAVYAVAYSPDGRLVATAAGDRTVKVWSVATGKRLFTLSESTAELYSLAFRPNGRQSAAGGVDKALRVWNLTPAGGKLAKETFAHEGAVLRVCYSHDGKTIYTSGEDRAVKRFDADTLEERKNYGRQSDWPQAIAVSADDRLLAVGRYDGGLTLYDVNSGKKIRDLLRGTPVAAAPPMVPRSSAVAGVKAGTHQKKKLKTGGPTLFEGSLAAIDPPGAARGMTVRCTFTGSRIADATAVYTDDPAITAKVVLPANSNMGILKADVTIGANASVGIHRLFVQASHGATNSASFAVGGGPDVPRDPAAVTPMAAQPIVVPCTVVGNMMKAEDRAFYRLEAKAGEELTFETLAGAIRSKMQPLVAILDGSGKMLTEGGSLFGFRFPTAGWYVVRVRDGAMQAGGGVLYRLNIGAFPLVTKAEPKGIRAGAMSEVTVEGFCLGGRKSLEFRAPSEAAWGMTTGIPVSAVPNRGPGADWHSEALGGVRLAVGADPEVRQASDDESVMRSQRIDLPVTVSGRLTKTADGDGGRYWRFTARKGERLAIDVLARRMGSPLDSVVEVLDGAGRPVESVILRPVGKTELTLSDRSSEGAAFRLLAWDDFHLNDYLLIGREVVQIAAMPKGPDDDMAMRSIGGQRVCAFGTTPEYHTIGCPIYKVEAFPPGTVFSANGMPLTRLYYRNDDGGAMYGRDSYLRFTAPADGDYVVHLADVRGRTGDDYFYRLMIHPPRPDFRVRMNPVNPNIPHNGALVINVECDRFDGFDGPIEVRLEGVPAGFSATSSVIEAHEMSTNLAISASPGAMTPANAAPIRLIATARIDGREVVRTIEPENGARVVTVIPPADVAVSTDVRDVTLHPGEEAVIDASIVRQNEFGARVPIEVRNLPFGVLVENIGLNGILVTEEDTSRKIYLRCAPWVKPQTRPLYVIANVEGGTANAAYPIMLHIEPRTPNPTAARSAARSTPKARLNN